MINSRDLRLGNFLKSKEGDIVIVTKLWDTGLIEVHSSIFQFYDFNEKEEHPFEPIPLTPEILEKAGFNSFTYGQNYEFTGYIKYWGKGNILTGFLNYEGAFCLLKYSNCHKIIKSLHEIQNLSFALTGEELEINL